LVSLTVAVMCVWSVAYVSRSGGMSNELNNIICLNADGAYEGVAIGGNRYRKQLFVMVCIFIFC